jgi:hypothetical protein
MSPYNSRARVNNQDVNRETPQAPTEDFPPNYNEPFSPTRNTASTDEIQANVVLLAPANKTVNQNDKQLTPINQLREQIKSL